MKSSHLLNFAPREGGRPGSARTPPLPNAALKHNPQTGYSSVMYIREYYVVFPDGEQIETEAPPAMSALLDANGLPHALPLKTVKTLAYRVCGKRTVEKTGFSAEFYLLEQMGAEDLAPYTRR